MNKFFILIFVFFTSLDAHAYIDPGSGLLLLQGIFALIGAVFVFIRSPLKALRRLVSKIRGRDERS